MKATIGKCQSLFCRCCNFGVDRKGTKLVSQKIFGYWKHQRHRSTTCWCPYTLQPRSS